VLPLTLDTVPNEALAPAPPPKRAPPPAPAPAAPPAPAPTAAPEVVAAVAVLLSCDFSTWIPPKKPAAHATAAASAAALRLKNRRLLRPGGTSASGSGPSRSRTGMSC
jgi:hypothetical protein